MKQRRLIFEDTGERRHPLEGEFYRWLRGPHVVLFARGRAQSKGDVGWTDPPEWYAILRKVEDGLDGEAQAVKLMHALGRQEGSGMLAVDMEVEG